MENKLINGDFEVTERFFWTETRQQCTWPSSAKAGTFEDYLSFNWAGLRYQHTTAIRSKLAASEGRASHCEQDAFCTPWRSCPEQAWRLELMTGEDYYRAKDVDNVSVSTLPAGRGLDVVRLLP